MKAINTFYNGYYYRSRLEARWAFFFDQNCIRYEYEPIGFEYEGDKYLPDFYLPDVYLRSQTKGVYVEIKRSTYEEEFIRQADWFTEPLVMFRGAPHENLFYGAYHNELPKGNELVPGWDNFMGIWRCHLCSTVKIEFAEGNYDYCPKCRIGRLDDVALSVYAEQAAKARFEHGKVVGSWGRNFRVK